MTSKSSPQAFYYRYRDYRTAAMLDEREDPIGPSGLEVVLDSYPVLKHTPKGVWLDVWGEKRFVRQGAKRQFACPNEEAARASFIARKKAQHRIFMARADDALKALRKLTGENRSCLTRRQ